MKRIRVIFFLINGKPKIKGIDKLYDIVVECWENELSTVLANQDREIYSYKIEYI